MISRRCGGEVVSICISISAPPGARHAAQPAPAIRTLARVLIQSFHDCAALAALRVPGSPLTVNIYSGHNYLHTQSALHWCRAATLTWAPGTAWTWCWFGSVGAGICNGGVLGCLQMQILSICGLTWGQGRSSPWWWPWCSCPPSRPTRTRAAASAARRRWRPAPWPRAGSSLHTLQ